MSSLVDAELPQQPELLVTLVTVQQLVRVLLLGLSQLVAHKVLLQSFSFIEAFVTGGAGEGFDVTHHVLLQLVPLVETFVTKLAEEPLLFIQLPSSPPLQLLLLFLITGWWKTVDTSIQLDHCAAVFKISHAEDSECLTWFMVCFLWNPIDFQFHFLQNTINHKTDEPDLN